MKKSGWIRNWEDWTYSQEYHLVPDEMTGSHGDPAHSVDGQVLTAQPGSRSSLRTGASLSSHVRVTWHRHAQPSAGYPGALLSLQHVSRCRPPLQGGTARARGGLALSPHASLLTTAALSQSHLDMHRDEETVQGGTEGEGPGASKGRPHLPWASGSQQDVRLPANEGLQLLHAHPRLQGRRRGWAKLGAAGEQPASSCRRQKLLKNTW